MASWRARELRREFKKNGFLVVESTVRTYKRKYGIRKTEILPATGTVKTIPEGVTSKTHPHLFQCRVRQTEATKTKFKVVRGSNNLVTIYRKNGTGMKLCATYYWTGRKLRLLTMEEYMRRGFYPKAPTAYERQGLPRLSHEQCVDIENALIRL